MDASLTSILAPEALMIDGDAPPVEPYWAQLGKTVQMPCGQVDPATLVFFQTEEMKNGDSTPGLDLSDKIRQAKLKPVNANVAVFLEAHQEFLASVPRGIDYLVFTESQFLRWNNLPSFQCLRRWKDGRWYPFDYITWQRYGGEDAAVAFRVDEPTK
ncbi:TPA: hypothetical protein DEP96_01360 [Candidatus Uhrbacteria bacterium]|nr:hypothetical protein [Candidatus Uhrbacteria bacterium]